MFTTYTKCSKIDTDRVSRKIRRNEFLDDIADVFGISKIAISKSIHEYNPCTCSMPVKLHHLATPEYNEKRFVYCLYGRSIQIRQRITLKNEETRERSGEAACQSTRQRV